MKKNRDFGLMMAIIGCIAMLTLFISLGGYILIDVFLCGLYEHKLLCGIFKFIWKPAAVITGISFVIFYILDKAEKKALLKSIVRTEKSYYKGRVISKDKTTKTSGERGYVDTHISYTTTVRLEGSESIIYFYDAQTFNECFEGELVSVEIQEHYDKDDNLVLTDYYHRGSASAV